MSRIIRSNAKFRCDFTNFSPLSNSVTSQPFIIFSSFKIIFIRSFFTSSQTAILIIFSFLHTLFHTEYITTNLCCLSIFIFAAAHLFLLQNAVILFVLRVLYTSRSVWGRDRSRKPCLGRCRADILYPHS